jgi:hypothetical protein
MSDDIAAEPRLTDAELRDAIRMEACEAFFRAALTSRRAGGSLRDQARAGVSAVWSTCSCPSTSPDARHTTAPPRSDSGSTDAGPHPRGSRSDTRHPSTGADSTPAAQGAQRVAIHGGARSGQR